MIWIHLPSVYSHSRYSHTFGTNSLADIWSFLSLCMLRCDCMVALCVFVCMSYYHVAGIPSWCVLTFCPSARVWGSGYAEGSWGTRETMPGARQGENWLVSSKATRTGEKEVLMMLFIIVGEERAEAKTWTVRAAIADSAVDVGERQGFEGGWWTERVSLTRDHCDSGLITRQHSTTFHYCTLARQPLSSAIIVKSECRCYTCRWSVVAGLL